MSSGTLGGFKHETQKHLAKDLGADTGQRRRKEEESIQVIRKDGG